MGDFITDLFGGGDAPDYEVPKMDPGTSEFIMDQAQSGAKPWQSIDIMKRRIAGLEGTNLLNPAAQNDLDGKAMSEAIKQKAQKSYDREINKMKAQAEIEAEVEAGRRLDRSSRLVNQVVSANRAINNRVRAAIEAKRAARNQALGNILGVAGMVAGAAIAGPVGASAGAAVGRSMATKSSEPESSDYFSESKPRKSQRYSVLD